MTRSEVFPVGAASGAQASHSDSREVNWEGEQGSIAKRWSRRTGAAVEGKIESRGVELVYPVGGEPGARARIAGKETRKGASERGQQGSKRELLAERNEFNITSGLLIFAANQKSFPSEFPLQRIVNAHIQNPAIPFIKFPALTDQPRLQRPRRLQALAQNVVAGRNFRDHIGVDHISPVGQCVAERDRKICGSRFQWETLVADSRGAPILSDRDDYYGEVKFVFGAIGNLNRTVNSVVVDLGCIEPFEDQRADNRRLKAFLYRMRRMTRISSTTMMVSGPFSWTAGKYALRLIERPSGSLPSTLQR